jgi:hypothetical protein
MESLRSSDSAVDVVGLTLSFCLTDEAVFTGQ